MFRSFLRSSISALVLGFALVAAPADAAAPTAMETFQQSHAAVTKLVKTGAPNDKIQAQVDGFLDYHWIAEQALGGNGGKRCEPRCAEFETLLTRLIRENYLSRIRQADKGKIEYKGEELRRDGTKAKVDTVVTYTTPEGATQSLKVDYVMHKLENGQWVCRNIITDGVSLAKNYRFEFNKVLRDEGIDGLIARLETKLAEVAKAG